MTRFYTWVKRWEIAEEKELRPLLDELDDILCEIIGNCESELIDTTELRKLLSLHRTQGQRDLDAMQDVPEKVDWALKRIAAERNATAVERQAEVDHATPPVVDPFEQLHDRLKNNGATDKEIAKSWIASRSPVERNRLTQEGEEAVASLVRKCTNLRLARKKAANKPK